MSAVAPLRSPLRSAGRNADAARSAGRSRCRPRCRPGPPPGHRGLGRASAQHELGRPAADVDHQVRRDQARLSSGRPASSAVAPAKDSSASSPPLMTSGGMPSVACTPRAKSAALLASLVALVATIRTAWRPRSGSRRRTRPARAACAPAPRARACRWRLRPGRAGRSPSAARHRSAYGWPGRCRRSAAAASSSRSRWRLRAWSLIRLPPTGVHGCPARHRAQRATTPRPLAPPRRRADSRRARLARAQPARAGTSPGPASRPALCVPAGSGSRPARPAASARRSR